MSLPHYYGSPDPMDLLTLTFGVSTMPAITAGAGLVIFASFLANACIVSGSVRRGLSKSRRGISSTPRANRTCSGVACGERGSCMPNGVLAGCGATLGGVARASAVVSFLASLGATATAVVKGGSSSITTAVVLLCVSAVLSVIVTFTTLGAVAARGKSRGSLHACAVGVGPLATALSIAAAMAFVFTTDSSTLGLIAAVLAVSAAITAGAAAAGVAYLFVLWWHPAFRTRRQGPNSSLAWEWPRPSGERSAGCINCLCTADDADEGNEVDGNDDYDDTEGGGDYDDDTNAPLIHREFSRAPTPTAASAAYERLPTHSSSSSITGRSLNDRLAPVPSAPSRLTLSTDASPRSSQMSPVSSPKAPDNAAIRAAAARAVAALGGPTIAPTPSAPSSTDTMGTGATTIAIRAAVAQLSAPPPPPSTTPFRISMTPLLQQQPSTTSSSSSSSSTPGLTQTTTPAPHKFTTAASSTSSYQQPSPAQHTILPMSPATDVTSPTAGWQAGVTSPVYSPPPAPVASALGRGKKVVVNSSPLEDGEIT
jgi:hypothetical protein